MIEIEWVQTKAFKPAEGRIVLGAWTSAIMRTVVLRDGQWMEAPGYPYSSPIFDPPTYWSERPTPPESLDFGE
jgi:hypothetical protein